LCLSCLPSLYDQGMYTKSKNTVINGKVEFRAELGKMLDDGQLKQEWKDHPELYEGDCFKTYDLTPQLPNKFSEQAP